MSYSKTVAFARWQYPYTLTPEQKVEKDEKDEKRKRYHEFPEGSNKELQEEFFRQLMEGRKRFIVPEKTYCECLSVLSSIIDPHNYPIQQDQPNS